MKKTPCVLAIDQGTTSSRALVFDASANIVVSAQQEFSGIYPQLGWVEHDPELIWDTTVNVAKQAFAQAQARGFHVESIGITNQRETSVVWDRSNGKAIYNAIVWQDRRTADVCQQLKAQQVEAEVKQRTGLLLDPYFSASKIAWLLDNVDGARRRAEAGELAFGTIDSFLISRFTGGKVHATDATNACRTSLYNIHQGQWDETLLTLFNVPAAMLPKVNNSIDDFGETSKEIFGRCVPIFGVAGDQQAASIGQCCFDVGSIKSTYGTGCFVLMNTGKEAVVSNKGLLTTIAYQIDGQVTYALEGAIFAAGSTVKWLRDGLGIISDAAQTESIARNLKNNGGVYLVPAFSGLGAPWWNSKARAAILGMSLATDSAHLVRAALESVCYQTADLFEVMSQEGISPSCLRVDGGMVANNWLLQFMADVVNIKVQRPLVMETTALGAAFLSGIKSGVYTGFSQLANDWQCQATFQAAMHSEARQQLLAQWRDAVTRVVSE